MAGGDSIAPPPAARKRRRRSPGGLLTGTEIADLGIISENYEAVCLRPTSYDLRLGREFLRPSKDNGTSEFLLDGTPLVIPKFSSVIVSTHEILQLPGSVAGKFNLKIKMALRGLFVQMGTQVEPNYKGRLFALLQNISDSEITIHPECSNNKIFAMEFYYTSQSVPTEETGFGQQKIERIGQFIKKMEFTGTINNVTTDLMERLNGLEKESKSLAEDLKRVHEQIADFKPQITSASDKIFTLKTALIGGGLLAALSIIVAVVAPIASRLVYDAMADDTQVILQPTAPDSAAIQSNAGAPAQSDQTSLGRSAAEQSPLELRRSDRASGGEIDRTLLEKQ